VPLSHGSYAWMGKVPSIKSGPWGGWKQRRVNGVSTVWWLRSEGGSTPEENEKRNDG